MEEIKKSLILYDKNRFIFNQSYPKIISIKFDDDNGDLKESKVYINNDPFNYSVLGRFDNSTNFWEWSWSFEKVKNKSYRIRQLLLYSLDNYDPEFEIINQISINTKFKISEKFNLDIILAISLRFLENHGYRTVYEIKETNTISKFIILKDITQ
jgi:hypothetical protein